MAYWPSHCRETLRRLGYGRNEWPWPEQEARVEWTMLASELVVFAKWLPLWVIARLDPKVPVSLPPTPSHVFGRGLRTTDYAWTAAAWDAYGIWSKQPLWLPRYAIPADKVIAD